MIDIRRAPSFAETRRAENFRSPTPVKNSNNMMGKNTVSTVIFASLLLLHMSGISARNPAAGDNGNGNGGLNHIPSFGNVEELCEWLCQKASPHFDYGCPESCGGMTNPWSKRSAIRRRFDDFSFDDYLFMKLLGRNLGDRQ